MQGILLGNQDIDLYLTRAEFRQISKDTLECKLQNNDGTDSGRKASLEHKNFDEMGDGINVDFDFEKETYKVVMNDHAYQLTNQRGNFGTRYGGREKITLYIDEQLDEDRKFFLERLKTP